MYQLIQGNIGGYEVESWRHEEWRYSVSAVVERIFAQRIYRNFIYTLCDIIEVEYGENEFGLDKSQIEWLVNSFVRDGLGAREEGYFCIFPLWKEEEKTEETIEICAIVESQQYSK